jgi:hypothetical protein
VSRSFDKFSWSLATNSSGAFTQSLGSGTIVQNAGNTALLFTNGFGYGVHEVEASLPASIPMTFGQAYWLTISNATDAFSDGTQAWDYNGGAAICNYRQSGTNFDAYASGTTIMQNTQLHKVVGMGKPSRSAAARPQLLSLVASCCSVLTFSASRE